MVPAAVKCGASYGNKLLCRLVDPTFATDVGLPSLLAVLALAFAVGAVRRQLASDRELHNAGPRKAAAFELGTQLDAALAATRSNSFEANYLNSHSWPEAPSVFAAVRAAQRSLGEAQAFSEVSRTADDLDLAWSACDRVARDLGWRPAPIGNWAAPVSDSLTVDLVLRPIVDDLNSHVATLMAWPGLSAPPAWKLTHYRHAPLSNDEEARKMWASFFSKRYRWFAEGGQVEGQGG